jgi:hypothetical protein
MMESQVYTGERIEENEMTWMGKERWDELEGSLMLTRNSNFLGNLLSSVFEVAAKREIQDDAIGLEVDREIERRDMR